MPSLTTLAPLACICSGVGTLAAGKTTPLFSSTPRSLNMPGLTCTVTERAAPADDGVDRRRQRAHMVPMAMRDGDLLDLAKIEAEVAAVADENGAFGAGVEQRDMLAAAEARAQAQPVAEIGRQQRLAGDFLGAASTTLANSDTAKAVLLT